MTKTQQDYLGSNSRIFDSEVCLDLYDLADMAGIDYDDISEGEEVKVVIALIVAGLFNGAKPDTDDDGFSVIDNTQGIVADTRSSRSSIVTREGDRQVRHRFVIDIFTKNEIIFNPVDIVGSISPDSHEQEQGQFQV